MENLKDLYLFCENIPSQIIAGCNELFGYTPKLEPTFDKRTKKKYQVNIISDKERFLHIYHFKSDGKTTIQIQGDPSSKERSEKLAEFVATKCSIPTNSKNFNFSIPNVTEDKYNDFISYLKSECNAEEKQEKEISGGTQKFFEGDFHDKITINYYNTTNTLLIQGRPLKLYTQIAYFLTDKNFCESDFIKLQKERYNITFDFENLKYEYETRIPFHKKLNSDIATLLEVSVAVNKIECENLPDYSLFTMPVLRALEGFIQQVLSKHTGEIINKTDQTIGYFFAEDKNNFVLKNEFRKGVLQNYDIISKAYDLYNKKRNNLFHVNTVTGETVFIRNQKDASDIVNDVLQVIHEGSELYL